MKQGKIWGTTERIFCSPTVQVHRISIEEGGFCSLHKHAHKWNTFYVEDGQLKIEIFNENEVNDVSILTNGESSNIPPEVFHRFTALQNTIAYEIYWIEVDENDIHRKDTGGLL